MDKAECRWCRRELDGQPFHMGGHPPWDPVNRRSVKRNWYGGWVCSSECDWRASLELECSMPGHGSGQTKLGQAAAEHHRRNWPENYA
jgi:hypothetical protein